jgi:lipopolysaccharide export system ATP-binding protein
MGLSYLPQENSVFRQLTVEENILAVLQLNATSSRREAQAQIGSNVTLARIQIEHIRRQPAIALSGGERPSGLKLLEPWQHRPVSYCLTNPLRALIPLRSSKFSSIVSFLRDQVAALGVLITDHNVQRNTWYL